MSEALAVKGRKHIPLVGASVDRRALQSVGEVFNKNHVSVMICFICGCKHVQYAGYDMFGKATNKGKISQVCDSRWLTKLFSEDGKPTSILSLSTFQDLYGEAVASDPFLQNGSSEWVRRVHSSGEFLMCCPEDVQLSSKCKHPNTDICVHCQIPVCHECVGFVEADQLPPKALSNDNFISYADAFTVREQVTWLEATIACPIFTGMVTY